MTVWFEAKLNFLYFDRIPDIDWDAKIQEYIPRAMKADTLDSYYDVLMEFAALLKDGHTQVIPPWMFVKPGYDHPPVELQVVEGRVLVARDIQCRRGFSGAPPVCQESNCQCPLPAIPEHVASLNQLSG